MPNIIAHWPAPKHINALTTSIESNNLSLTVGDAERDVHANRQALYTQLGFTSEPAWLTQTHSNHCVVVEDDSNRTADAAITRLATQPLVILTADCLPILLCNTAGTEIAAIHAGWRGLLHGIVQQTLATLHAPANTLLAWIGPAICQACYETSPDVKQQFIDRYPFAAQAFNGRFANLPLLADLMLRSQNVSAVYHANVCTYEQNTTCYSYRRTAQTGRMGSFIWFNNTKDRAL